MLCILKVINRLIVMMLMRLILKHLKLLFPINKIKLLPCTLLTNVSLTTLLPRKVIIHLQSHVKFQYPI